MTMLLDSPAPATVPADPRALVEAQGNRFFRVTFRRRSDGTLRTMICRRHVVAFAAGKTPPGFRAAEDAACGCLTVWEAATRGYRRVPLDGIMEIAAAGQTHPLGALAAVRAAADRTMQASSPLIRGVQVRSFSRSWHAAYRAAVAELCDSWGCARAVLRMLIDAREYGVMEGRPRW